MTVASRIFFPVLAILILLSAEIAIAQEIEPEEFQPELLVGDCTYLRSPDEFLRSTELHRADVSKWTETVGNHLKFTPVRSGALADSQSASMPRKNFIDEYIFGRMERDGI